MNKEELYNKDSLSMDEMCELFVANKPGFVPTKSAVGRFAKRIGFHLANQRLNGKQVYFYVKNKFA